VFLDTEERKWFAQNPHQYVIQQIQMNQFPIKIDATQRDYNFALNFNHPAKCLLWAVTPGATTHGQYSGLPGEQDAEVLAPLERCNLLLNGIERFQTRKGSYFTKGNPWSTYNGTYCSAGIYAYGFGVTTGTPAPSGTLNFSRVDSATLRVRTKSAVVVDTSVPGIVTESMASVSTSDLNTMLVFAPNYNVLKIESGMGGIAFAN
jgi:hypothetical protein